MALEQITFNIGAFNDANAGGNNYYTGTVFEVKKQSDNTFASIYSDPDGGFPIAQNGIDNLSNSIGECNFYIDTGDYYIEVDSKRKNFNVGLPASFVANLNGGSVQDYINENLTPFKSAVDMESASYLSLYPEYTRVVWQGRFTQSDGGSNWGVLRFGAHTADGGSIFSIDSNTYVKANLTSKVNVKKFGCKVDANSDTTEGTPTGTDDYDAFYKCLTYTVANGASAFIPAGNMLIGSTIDIDSLPYGDLKGVNIIGTKVKTGRTYTSQIKGKAGLTNLFTQAFDAGLSKQRPITLVGFGVISEDPWEDLTVRAPLRAFDLYSCPSSHFERLHFFGITSGLHTRACWLSSYEDITTNRCSQGIFCDGDDGDGGYGFADHCSFNNITNSGWVSTFGLWLRGCKSPTLNRIDGETGHTGNALIIEGCHNVDFRGGYFEAFRSVTPVVIRPIVGSTLDDLEEFSTSVTMTNIHGLTNKVGLISIIRGCLGVRLNGVRNIRVDGSGRDDEAGEWLVLSAGAASEGFANYTQNIIIDGDISDSDVASSITNLTAHSQMFNYDGTVIQRDSNKTFYGLTLKRGMTLINTALNTVEKVIDSGTLNSSITITANSTADSRILTGVSSFTGLYVGTLVSFNGQDRLKVTSLDRANNIVYLGTEIASTVTGGSLTYTPPTTINLGVSVAP
ncbi:hypothetical protein BOX08_gp25 [Pseudoalteromonas phage BS5]|uniref:hypothetical protein n=1 Tax=Pseudoalteromonas phage BS5 TaxID=1874539 RepID=UPI000819A1DB|nr:hypothetical protein BOX08_gp25 [Pseudoalteromonas phage BS5]ANY29590.1 hypothetical protein [Pseudoalteromonas phage BS5]